MNYSRKWKLPVCLLLLLCLLPAGALGEIVKLPIDHSGGMPYDAKFTLETKTYDDPSIHVERYRVENSQTDFNCIYYYAKIKIADASQIRTASANGFDRPNQVLASVMARRVNAVLAINGDFFSIRPESFVLRQGVVYRNSVGPNLDVLLIDEDGDFHVIMAKDNPDSVDKTTWNGKKIINGFGFGPALIINDEVVLDESSSPILSAPESRSQRNCIIQTGPLEYVVITCREVGCTTQEMVDLVKEVVPGHIDVAYLLDGGQSAQMVFLGNLINKQERSARNVSDIVYFASAYVPEE